MKPYFETDLGKLYNADCLDVMREMGDKSIDLVLTDPNYGIGEADGKNHSRGKLGIAKKYDRKQWDNQIPDKSIFDEMFRTSINQIIFGGNYFIEYLKNTSCFIIWDKDNTGDFADCELAWTSFQSAVRKIKIRWNGMLQENMKNKEIRHHPTQKPVDLARWCLDRYAQKGQLIADFFAGSGSFLIACEEAGFRWIGVEKEKDYCDIIVNRLKNVTPMMF